jgi:antitoxin component of MazEF toxin-antitoxin module
MADDVGLTEGCQVEIETENHRLVITPMKHRYTLAELLKGATPEDYHESVVDWGSDVGREVVD